MNWVRIGNLFRLRVTLLHVKPACWREIEILGWTCLDELHGILQTIMPWENAHLHQFHKLDPFQRRNRPDFDVGLCYSDPMFEIEDAQDQTPVRIDQILKNKGDRLWYEYDFGDGWMHEIRVLAVSPHPTDARDFPRCLAGEGECPPEDCGGSPGWEELQALLRDPTAEDEDGRREWYGLKKGKIWHPQPFDAAATNQTLAWARPKPRKPRKKKT